MAAASGGPCDMEDSDEEKRLPPELVRNESPIVLGSKYIKPTTTTSQAINSTVTNTSVLASTSTPSTSAAFAFALNKQQVHTQSFLVNRSIGADANGVPKRIRSYSANQPGPYSVVIRENKIKITPITFASYINQTYKSVKGIKRSPAKLSVTLNDLNEANNLVKDNFFKEFTVSIPADRVEVEGAFNCDELSDLKDMKVLTTNGVGGFNNTALPYVNIVHAERISKADPNYPSTQRVYTNTIKVVFEGQILPNFILIEGLRIRIRPFHKKPMFCDNCLKFKHTSKYCRSPAKCALCEGDHQTRLCNNVNKETAVCSFCLISPVHDRKDCPYFKEAEEGFNAIQAARRKNRYNKAIANGRSAEQADQNTTTHASDIGNDRSQFPALNNRFESLSIDQIQEFDSTQIPASRPKNPYAKALKTGKNFDQPPRKIAKRHHNVLSQNESQIEVPDVNTFSVSTPTVQSSTSQNNSTLLALKTAILVLVRKANVSEIWIQLLEAIIDPLLQSILPQQTVPFGNMSQTVRNGCP